MFVFYNAHPKGLLVDDCVKRSISKAYGIDYKEIALRLNRYKKITKTTVYNDMKNVIPFIEHEMRGIKISFPARSGELRMNGERFCKRYPKGSYVLRMAGHMTACVDGSIYDTWNCTQNCVYVAWKLPSPSLEKHLKQIEKLTAEIDSCNEHLKSLVSQKNKLLRQYLEEL